MNGLLNRLLELPNGEIIRNRIGKSAMSENLGASDGGPRPDVVRLYERWADGGAGLLITGNVIVDGSARTDPHNVVVEDERHLADLTRWAAAAKRHGTIVLAQINHAGRQAVRTEDRPVAPSEVPMKGLRMIFKKPRALTSDEVEAIVERFVTTALVLEKAGFSGVQIHAAHGYLISQFLSPLSNRRDDAWGGDPRRRMRLLMEVVRRVRAAVSKDFVLGVKLNSADFMRGGFDEEESMNVVRALDGAGIDLLEISGGNYESPAMMGTKKRSTVRREAYFLEYAEKVRDLTSVPLMVTGGFRTKSGMIDALTTEAADIVGVARPLAVEPSLPLSLMIGEVDAAKSLNVHVGIRLLDNILQASWYQDQIHRMGAGLEPDVHLGRWGSIWRSVKERIFTGVPKPPVPVAMEATV